MAKKVTVTGTTRKKRSVNIAEVAPATEVADVSLSAGAGVLATGGHGALPRGCPPMNPMQGDKTPAVVAWLKEHEPSEFERRYKGRRIKF